MPFEKIYTQRLRTFPPELRDGSIQYHELKKIIGRLVDELNDLGLSPETLRQVIPRVDSSGGEKSKSISTQMGISEGSSEEISLPLRGAKILYEVISESGKSFPQLRVYMATATLESETLSETLSGNNGTEFSGRAVDNLLHPRLEVLDSVHTVTLARDRITTSIPDAASVPAGPAAEREFVIPLVHDAEFFDLFEGNIQTLTTQMEKIHSEFLTSLLDLARMIADTCQPASVVANYRPYSGISTHAGTVDVKFKRMKSDLYAWREIFTLFEESDIFEHAMDGHKVWWSIEESEKRLSAFADKVAERWLSDKTRLFPMQFHRPKGQGSLKVKKFKHRRSAEALQIFIKLNFLILDIRKAFQANLEAIQKLVKKHTEHTSLPLSCSFSENANVFSIGHLHRSSCTPLSGLIHPRLFIQDIADKLFPIVPNQEDYACVICTSLAFKPIRLSCMHLFCVRCLVKMQKRGEGNCPMCRAPSVLRANARNVDWGLLNLMEDWFPREAREKLRANEKEVLNEQMAEWRRNERSCTIM